jgi:hypothetical protein
MVSSKMPIRRFSPFQFRLAWAPWWHTCLTNGYINQLKDPMDFSFLFRRVECQVLIPRPSFSPILSKRRSRLCFSQALLHRPKHTSWAFLWSHRSTTIESLRTVELALLSFQDYQLRLVIRNMFLPRKDQFNKLGGPSLEYITNLML